MSEVAGEPRASPDASVAVLVDAKGSEQSAETKAQMRAAGEKAFQQYLAQAGSSRVKGAAGPREPRRRREHAPEPEFLAVGRIITAARFYALAAVVVLCQAVGLLLRKESLEHLNTPALLAFCHQLPLLGALWGLSQHGDVDLRSISAAHVQASVPAALLTGLALVAALASLAHGDVLLVAAVMAVGGALLDVAAQLLGQRNAATALSPSQLASLSAASAGTLLLFLIKPRQSAFTLAMLALWAAATAVREAWRAVCSCPGLAVALLGGVQGAGVHALATTAASMDDAAHAFLSHALSVGPVLIAGLALQEGSELVEHEISVPSLSIILLSCASFAGAECGRVLLAPVLSRAAANLLETCHLGVVLVLICAQFPRELGVFSGTAMLLLGAGLASFRHLAGAEVA